MNRKMRREVNILKKALTPQKEDIAILGGDGVYRWTHNKQELRFNTEKELRAAAKKAGYSRIVVAEMGWVR